MSLPPEVKKQILDDPDSRNILIFPFVKNPNKDEVPTIDVLANYFVNQMVVGFKNYGFDIDDDEFDVDMMLVKQLTTAALYRNKRIAYSNMDILDMMRELLSEAEETKEVLGDELPGNDDEDDGAWS